MSFSIILGMFPGVLSMIAVYFVLKMLGLTDSLAGLVFIYSAGSGLGFLILKGFFDTIDKCRKNVYVVTTEGDRLNLKSKITQYIAFSDLFADQTIKDMELVFDDHEDENMVVDYLLNGGGIKETEE